MINDSTGAGFRKAVELEQPLQCVGAVNAYHARLAEAAGFRSLYVSGAGVAAGSCGVPDLGIITPEEVLVDVRRISAVTRLPILVDMDAGWGGVFTIARTVRAMIQAGAAAVHIEDQVQPKRCGHRPHKAIVSPAEMVDRIKAAVDARTDPDFVIMARTDALAVEGEQAAIERLAACVEAGADMIFPEAVTSLELYRQIATAVEVPVLANITEFGLTPLFTTTELAAAGVSIALYPLSAFRAANAAALRVYQVLRTTGTQQGVLESMQSRAELKSTFRLDQTTILQGRNNPIMLSQDTDDLVKQLLAGSDGEYLGPRDAIREVCRDLLVHQEAFLGAMTHAFVEFARRFDPEELAASFERSTGRKPLFRLLKELKYWGLYMDLYPTMTEKGNGRFPQMFAEDFFNAYERCIMESLREHRQSHPLPDAKREPLNEAALNVRHSAAQAPDDPAETADQAETASGAAPEDVADVSDLDELVDLDDLEANPDNDVFDDDVGQAKG